MKLDYSKISNVWVGGIDYYDAPDFVDSFIDSADYDGVKMTDAQLDELNEDSDFIYESLMKQLY